MKVWLKRLLHVELAMLAATLVVAVLGSIAFTPASFSSMRTHEWFEVWLWIAGVTFAVAAPVGVVYGAPIFRLMQSLRYDHWWIALAVGLVPGALLAFIEPGLSGYALICGGAIGVLTHGACRRFAPALGYNRPTADVPIGNR